MSQQSAESVLTGVRNFRDVGGLPTRDGRRVRHGVLYRSGHLANATPEDAAYLGSLGLHTVFDFRNSADLALDGVDVELPGVRNVHMPLNDPADGAEFWKMVRGGELDELRAALADGKGEARMIDTYRALITTRTEEHGRLLRAIAEETVPALLHCAAGKDRAGMSIAIVLMAVGVDHEAVEADYLLSNAPGRRYLIHRGSRVKDGLSAEVVELLSPLFDARATYLAAAMETIEETWGGVEHYLTKGLGLTDETRDRLRERLLEKD
ncbi:tyrosine-protein phosphatase [Streptomyces xiaopingdaonensis]|uniref:tyrosine-protein phosphatase n=1 Tax=Streptomyces xiaopingdaonensis TaxID=1565415 RepID=UPI0002D7B04E|nr:tyrosine-protein phosphatase [Streptomyces xiaopingdaonensis]